MLHKYRKWFLPVSVLAFILLALLPGQEEWFGFDLAPDDLEAPLARLDELLAEAGRRREDIAIQVSPNRRPIDAGLLAAYRNRGVDQLVLPLFALDAAALERRADALAGWVRLAEEG